PETVPQTPDPLSCKAAGSDCFQEAAGQRAKYFRSHFLPSDSSTSTGFLPQIMRYHIREFLFLQMFMGVGILVNLIHTGVIMAVGYEGRIFRHGIGNGLIEDDAVLLQPDFLNGVAKIIPQYSDQLSFSDHIPGVF